MRTIAKAAFGALALASLGAMTTTPADAQVSFGLSFGAPGYRNACFRPYAYRPAYCFRHWRPAYRPYAYGYYERPYAYGYRAPYYRY